MAGSLERADLAVRARPVARDHPEVLDLFARPERVEHVVDEREQLFGEVAHRYFRLLAEVDELRVHPAPHRAPLVLLDEAGHVPAEAEVPPPEHDQLRADGLDQARDAEGLVDLRRRVAHAELDGRIEGMRPQIPPDLLPVVDALCAHEQLDVVLVLVPGRELRRDASAREALPHDLAVRLEAGVAGEPERARGRDGEEVRQEVARLVHDLDALLAVGDPDVDV